MFGVKMLVCLFILLVSVRVSLLMFVGMLYVVIGLLMLGMFSCWLLVVSWVVWVLDWLIGVQVSCCSVVDGMVGVLLVFCGM